MKIIVAVLLVPVVAGCSFRSERTVQAPPPAAATTTVTTPAAPAATTTVYTR
jgi:hypothetical protein